MKKMQAKIHPFIKFTLNTHPHALTREKQIIFNMKLTIHK